MSLLLREVLSIVMEVTTSLLLVISMEVNAHYNKVLIGNNFAGGVTGITYGQDRGNWVCCIAPGPYAVSLQISTYVTVTSTSAASLWIWAAAATFTQTV